ncbi:hypothetical protein [Streptodolium elevatio]
MPRHHRAPRPIHVDGEAYRWHVGGGGSGELLLRVWRADGGKTRRLHVTIEFFDLWLYFPWYAGAPEERRAALQVEPVRPRFVAAAVREARAAGWDPGDRRNVPPACPWPDAVKPDPDALPRPLPVR